jgi:hypothetical protein
MWPGPARAILSPVKKPKNWSQPRGRTHVSRDDRARTWSGKTADSKVRSEGRHMAAIERKAEPKHAYQAAEAKDLATAESARQPKAN